MLIHRLECTPTEQYHKGSEQTMMSSTILGDDVLHFITTISSKFCKHLGDLSQGWVKKCQHFALQVLPCPICHLLKGKG